MGLFDWVERQFEPEPPPPPDPDAVVLPTLAESPETAREKRIAGLSAMASNLGGSLIAQGQRGMPLSYRANARVQMANAGEVYRAAANEVGDRHAARGMQALKARSEMAEMAREEAFQKFMAEGGGGMGGGAPAAPQAGVPQSALAAADKLARIAHGEAAGEGDQGLAAVMHVALNRARLSGRPLEEELDRPNAFEPRTNPATWNKLSTMKPEQYANAARVAQAVLSGQIPDPTNGATHFYSPTAQAALGRERPAWAVGDGFKLGNHTFYSIPQDFRRTQVAGPSSTPLPDATAPVPRAAPGPVPTGVPNAALPVAPNGRPPGSTPPVAPGQPIPPLPPPEPPQQGPTRAGPPVPAQLTVPQQRIARPLPPIAGPGGTPMGAPAAIPAGGMTTTPPAAAPAFRPGDPRANLNPTERAMIASLGYKRGTEMLLQMGNRPTPESYRVLSPEEAKRRVGEGYDPQQTYQLNNKTEQIVPFGAQRELPPYTPEELRARGVREELVPRVAAIGSRKGQDAALGTTTALDPKLPQYTEQELIRFGVGKDAAAVVSTASRERQEEFLLKQGIVAPQRTAEEMVRDFRVHPDTARTLAGLPRPQQDAKLAELSTGVPTQPLTEAELRARGGLSEERIKQLTGLSRAAQERELAPATPTGPRTAEQLVEEENLLPKTAKAVSRLRTQKEQDERLGQIRSSEQQQHDNFRSRPSVTTYDKAVPIYAAVTGHLDVIRDTIKNGRVFGKQDQVAAHGAVMGLANMFDPLTGVRESEVKDILAREGFGQDLINRIVRFQGGQQISPDLVEEIERAVETRLKAYGVGRDYAAREARKMAERNGLHPDNVAPEREDPVTDRKQQRGDGGTASTPWQPNEAVAGIRQRYPNDPDMRRRMATSMGIDPKLVE